MIQVRNNIFETNSSSVHSITLCPEDEFKKWKNGELLFDRYNDKLISLKEAEGLKEEMRIDRRKYYGDSEDEYEDRGRFLTYNQFFDWQGDDNYMDYMEKYQSHQNINGVDVVAFGYYGHD